MISFTVLKSSADMKRYYSHPDYYVQDQQTHAFFGGKLAERLGLKDFDLQAFHDLCDGVVPGSRSERNPDGTQLTPGTGIKRAGYDVTLDGPKDLGVLMALGMDDRIPEVLERAGKDVMSLIERDAKTRVRIGKQDTDRSTGELVYTGILHTTSRPVGDMIDVQPHFHMVVANATWDPVEKRMKALQLQPYALNGAKEARPYYTAYFNARLAQHMQALGYSIEKTKDSFKVTGIPERVRKEFSQRTQKIEAVAAKLEKQKQEFLGDPTATLNPEVKGRLGAHTREAKKPGKTWESLLEHWNSRVTDSERQAIEDTVAKSRRGPIQPEMTNAAALDWSIRHSFERSSVVSERELITTALKHGLGTVTPEGILEAVSKRKDLIRRDIGGQVMVSTQGVLAEEKAIVAFAERGRGKWRPMGGYDPRLIKQSVLRDSVDPAHTVATADIATLSPSQQAAIRHVWQSRDPLMVVRGAAGTGKTTMTKAMLAGVNVPYVILAPSAEASRGVLRKEGFTKADTLQKFLIDEELQGAVKNGLIVLDEASLAGAHDLSRLVESADRLKARVLLLGDRRQHKSVARGDVLALLEDKAKLKVVEVSEIKRQSGEYKTAVKLASEGKTIDAFARLDKLGWIKEGHDTLVEDYIEALKTKKPNQTNQDRVIVVAPTHAEGDTVTVKLRTRLKQEGILHGEEKRFETLTAENLTEAQKTDPQTLRQNAGQVAQFVRNAKGIRPGDRVEITEENAADLAKLGSRFVVYRKSNVDLAAGDTIRITATGETKDKHRLNNGAVYTVAGFTDAGNIRLNNGWIVDKGFKHLQHGLVSTSYGVQGRTSDRVLVAQSTFGASDKSQFYVSLSRGRQQATIYTNDKESLLEAVNRERPRMLASELVRKPRHKLKDRISKHLRFLRDLATGRTHEPKREHQQSKTVGMEM